MRRRATFLSLLFLGGIGFLVARAVTLKASSKRAFPELPRPLAFAHRGGLELWPENTILAFERAAELGVDVLELDVRLSRDGEVVVHHDATLERTSDGVGQLAARTLKELRELDFGARFAWPAGERKGPLRIPTFDEVLRHFPDRGVNIDIKVDGKDCARATAEIIERHRAEDRVLVTSFHDAPIRYLRKNHPRLAIGTSESEIRTFFALSKIGLEGWIRPRGVAYQVPPVHGSIRVVTPRFVRAAHRLGQEVHVWTINDVETMRDLLEMGVDGIMTDRPDLLMEVLSAQDAKPSTRPPTEARN